MTTRSGPKDAVVVGAGIVGVCTALILQRTGRAVALVERGEPGEEASGYNGGAFSGDCLPTGMPSVIRSLPRMLRNPDAPLAIQWRYLPRLAPWLVRFALSSRPSRVESITTALGSLMSRGTQAYRPLVTGTDAEVVFEQRGLLQAFNRRESLAATTYSRDLRTRRGVPFEVWDAGAVAAHDPALTGLFEGAIYNPDALFTTDPGALTRTLAAEFRAAGGQFVSAEVTGFRRRSTGEVYAVETSADELTTDAVVICAGPWSRQLLRRLGTDVPLDAERGYGVDLADPGMRLVCPVILGDYHVGVSPHRGGLRLTGLDELASVSAPPNMRLIERIVRVATRVFPKLRTDGGRPWMRRRPSMPDSLPVIGRAPGHDNVYLAFGHGHKGLCMGAITGQLVRELADGIEPSVDLTPFRPTRFRPRGSHGTESLYDIVPR